MIAQLHLPDEQRGADLSECGTYRYRLWRIWDPALARICWIMLNPSTADALLDDATVRRCVGFSRAWGYGSLEVVNLFALRSTDPRALRSHPDPVGPENDLAIESAVRRSLRVVAAWGNHGWIGGRDEIVRDRLRRLGVDPYHLGLTKQGRPRHPVRLAKSTELQLWT